MVIDASLTQQTYATSSVRPVGGVAMCGAAVEARGVDHTMALELVVCVCSPQRASRRQYPPRKQLGRTAGRTAAERSAR